MSKKLYLFVENRNFILLGSNGICGSLRLAVKHWSLRMAAQVKWVAVIISLHRKSKKNLSRSVLYPVSKIMFPLLRSLTSFKVGQCFDFKP